MVEAINEAHVFERRAKETTDFIFDWIGKAGGRFGLLEYYATQDPAKLETLNDEAFILDMKGMYSDDWMQTNLKKNNLNSVDPELKEAIRSIEALTQELNGELQKIKEMIRTSQPSDKIAETIKATNYTTIRYNPDTNQVIKHPTRRSIYEI